MLCTIHLCIVVEQYVRGIRCLLLVIFVGFFVDFCLITFIPFLSKLPYWIQSFLPRVFYVTEKAWNYYPFTITGKSICLYNRYK